MEKKNSPKVYVKFSLSSLSLPFLCFFFFSSFSRKKSLCSPPCSSPCSSFFYVQKSLLHSSLQAAISARPKRSPPSLGSLFFSYFSPQNLPLCSAFFCLCSSVFFFFFFSPPWSLRLYSFYSLSSLRKMLSLPVHLLVFTVQTSFPEKI